MRVITARGARIIDTRLSSTWEIDVIDKILAGPRGGVSVRHLLNFVAAATLGVSAARNGLDAPPGRGLGRPLPCSCARRELRPAPAPPDGRECRQLAFLPS
jgi:hypothetical protein